MTKIFAAILFLFSASVWGAQPSQYVDLARNRQYKGGADESDLKVQAVLYQAPTKKKKQINLDPQDGGF